MRDKNKGKILLCSWTRNVHIIYLFFFLFLAVFLSYIEIDIEWLARFFLVVIDKVV